MIKDIQNTKENIDLTGQNWSERPFSKPNNTIRIATSFSGIGAIEHAFNRLGLNAEIVFAGDIDEDCRKAYFANYRITSDRWHKDIHDFSAVKFRDQVDLLVGGAPCQAFSIRGKRGGLEDERGTLFNEFARVIQECRPKIFIFENVKGILSQDKGKTWNVIKETFEKECGYHIHYQVLNSKDYGIPQNRERVYCIGFKEDINFKFPAPIFLEKSIYDLLDKEVNPKYFLKYKGANFVTRSINHQKSYTQVNGNTSLCQKRNQQFNWHGDFIYHPLSLKEKIDGIDETIHDLSIFEENYFISDKIKNYTLIPSEEAFQMITSDEYDRGKGRFRKLSPRECLRLMGFDDSFNIVVSDTACYKQSGNSIVVNVLIALLKQLDITTYGTEI